MPAGHLPNLEETVVKQIMLLAASRGYGDESQGLGSVGWRLSEPAPPVAETPNGESEVNSHPVWTDVHSKSPGAQGASNVERGVTGCRTIKPSLPGSHKQNPLEERRSSISNDPYTSSVQCNGQHISKGAPYMQDTDKKNRQKQHAENTPKMT